MNYKVDGKKIYLSIDKGEYVNSSILKLCEDNCINFAWINGIGAILNPEVGYFDVDKKDYVKKQFRGDYELTSLIGNVTHKEGNLFVHSHITFTDTSFRAYGGHLFDCKVAAAAEFIIFLGDDMIVREYSDEVGLYLWNCRI